MPIILINPANQNQQRLCRLYCLKQRQLQRARRDTSSLLYRVLSAEADAIQAALQNEQG